MLAGKSFNASALVADVESKGLLVNREEDQPLTFAFTYCGFDFSVAAQPTSDGMTSMAIFADLGVLPFTAEGLASRRASIKILQGAAGRMGGTIKIGRNQKIKFAETITLSVPLTPVVLISHMVRILLSARPYLDLFLSEVKAPAAMRLLAPVLVREPDGTSGDAIQA